MPFMSGGIKPFEILHRKNACAMYSILPKWWLGIRFLILFLLTFQVSNAQQVLQTNRYELPLEKNDYYEVMPSQEDGIFLYRRLLSTDDDKIEIIKLDTAFKVNWKGFLSVDKHTTLVARRAINGQ